MIVRFLLIAGFAYAQQHGYSELDIDEGGRTYRRNCIGCHGGEGSSVTGVDLGRGKFRVATNDADLVRIILQGLPGTGMPATQMSEKRAGMVVAYLRTMNASRKITSIAAGRGDAKRGRELFGIGLGCAGCHRVNGVGGRSGPDLSDAGHLLRTDEMELAILDPDEQYPMGVRPVRVVRGNGGSVTGLLLNLDTHSVQLRDQEGRLVSLDRGEVRDVLEAKSWMPAFRGKVDSQQLADLIAYLTSLKGAQ